MRSLAFLIKILSEIAFVHSQIFQYWFFPPISAWADWKLARMLSMPSLPAHRFQFSCKLGTALNRLYTLNPCGTSAGVWTGDPLITAQVSYLLSFNLTALHSNMWWYKTSRCFIYTLWPFVRLFVYDEFLATLHVSPPPRAVSEVTTLQPHT